MDVPVLDHSCTALSYPPSAGVLAVGTGMYVTKACMSDASPFGRWKMDRSMPGVTDHC